MAEKKKIIDINNLALYANGYHTKYVSPITSSLLIVGQAILNLQQDLESGEFWEEAGSGTLPVVRHRVNAVADLPATAPRMVLYIVSTDGNTYQYNTEKKMWTVYEGEVIDLTIYATKEELLQSINNLQVVTLAEAQAWFE